VELGGTGGLNVRCRARQANSLSYIGDMFTGIIEELGTITALDVQDAGARLAISAAVVTSDLTDGDSVAVNGVCLTALEVGKGFFSADVSPETLNRTTLGGLQPGSRVNLERAVTLATRLGGHLVQGHVDGRGEFISANSEGDFWTIRVGFPVNLSKYLVHKGSVAVEGISLTIASLADTYFEIAVIPKTWEVTNLSTLKAGDPVNLEADMIAKYVERLMPK
jgi:riboflavin synthase